MQISIFKIFSTDLIYQQLGGRSPQIHHFQSFLHKPWTALQPDLECSFMQSTLFYIIFHSLIFLFIADGKLSRFLFKTRSNLYDFVLFGSARDIFWKEEGRLSLKYPCINVRTQSLYVSSRLRTFSSENNGFECALKVLLFTALIPFIAKI